MFFINLIINYIIPVIYDSFVVLVLVLFFLSILRIKDSNIKILFFALPIIKPIIVLIEKVNIDKVLLQQNGHVFGFRIPDPTKFIHSNEASISEKILNSRTNIIITVIIIIAVLSFLIARWINLALFYKKLAYEEKVTRKDIPEVYSMIDNFSGKIGITSPDVSLTHSNYISPFIVGLKKFTLVVSPGLLDTLDRNEKETLIQHELCHIKRNDNLIGWIMLILRDLFFYNPFAHIAYYLIRSEQEVACDKLVVQYSQKPPEAIAKDILNSILKLKLIIRARRHLLPVASSPFYLLRKFGQRRLTNRINSIITMDLKRTYAGLFPRVLLFILFIILFTMQIIITFNINNVLFFLR